MPCGSSGRKRLERILILEKEKEREKVKKIVIMFLEYTIVDCLQEKSKIL
jgi:hypothetical protein